jgi:hypothetical protein
MLALPRPPGQNLARELKAIFKADLPEDAERDRSAFVHMVVAESRSIPELDDVTHRLGFSEAVRLLFEWLEECRSEKLLDFEDPAACAEHFMHMATAPRLPRPGPAHFVRRPPSGNSNPWKDRLRFCIGVFLDGVRSR